MATPIPENRATFSLPQLEAATEGKLLSTGSKSEFTSVIIDSRTVTPGSIFVALRGANRDAHEFVAAAIGAGAAAVIVEDASAVPEGVDVTALEVPDTLVALGALAQMHRLRFDIPLIAITGSVGKTTTKDLAAAALEACGFVVHRTRGNLNNRIGVPMTLLGLEERHTVAVLELGMNMAGEIEALAKICVPRVGVVTAVSEAHTEGVGGIEGVAREKGALLGALPGSGCAIWNIDDVQIAPFAEQSQASKQLTYGLSEHADVQLTEHRVSNLGTHAVISIANEGTTVELNLALIGEGAARSAAGAVAIAYHLTGVEKLEEVRRGLARVQPSAGRSRPIEGPRRSLILDDTYNASPRSMQVAIATAADLAAKNGAEAYAVLGDMLELGAESERLHEEIGADAVTSGISELILCGDRMRAAARGAFARATEGDVSGVRIEHIENPAEAVDLIADRLRAGDVVLVKGSRGMRMERVVEGLVLRRESVPPDVATSATEHGHALAEAASESSVSRPAPALESHDSGEGGGDSS